MVVGALGIIHGVAPLVAPTGHGLVSVSLHTREIAAIYTLVGLLAFLAGWLSQHRVTDQSQILERNMARYVESPEFQYPCRKLFWITLLLGIIGTAVFISAHGVTTAEFIEASRFEYRTQANPWGTYIGGHLWQLLPITIFLGAILSQRYRIASLLLTLTLAVVWFFYIDHGGRRMPITFIGALLVPYLFRHRHERQFHLIMLVVIPLLVTFAVAGYEIRKHIHKESPIKLASHFLSLDSFQEIFTRDPLNYHQNTIIAIAIFPQDHPYLYGATYRRMMLFYLPRKYFPSVKPADTNRLFAIEAMGSDFKIEEMFPPSFPGETYINCSGWPGIVVMFIQGMILGWLSSRMHRNLLIFILFGSRLVSFSFVFCRGQPYELFVNFVIELVMILLLARICGLSFQRIRYKIFLRH